MSEERKNLAEQRRMYQGALYEDVRAAVRMVVSSMRRFDSNVGKTVNDRITDQFMVHPEIVRLYDPGASLRNAYDWEGMCGCDLSCCNHHGDNQVNEDIKE